MEYTKMEQPVWERLQQETRPIVLYGMGDGADKILEQFDRCGIRASGVFASDEFVRGHSFHGFRVMRLAEVLERFGEDIVIVLCEPAPRGIGENVCVGCAVRCGCAGCAGRARTNI